MGTWRITIEGTGCHHNGKPEIDADLATIEFVARLKAQGHTLSRATFRLTPAGQKQDLLQLPSPQPPMVDVTPNSNAIPSAQPTMPPAASSEPTWVDGVPAASPDPAVVDRHSAACPDCGAIKGECLRGCARYGTA